MSISVFHPRSAASAVLCFAWIVSACGGGGAEPASEASTTPGAAAGTKNACALVDKAELEAIAGQPLSMLHNIESDTQTTCEIAAASDPTTTLVYVKVYWSGGREVARANQGGMAMARQLLNDKDVDIEELTGSGNVPGLADQAFYSDLMPSWVLKDDVMIEVLSPMFDHEKTHGVFMAVVKKGLPRL